MRARNVARVCGVAVATVWALGALGDAGHASAGPCPDVEVVSARGTGDSPGPGYVGQAFVDALMPKIAGRSVDVYAVNYPAGDDLARSVPVGVDDARAHTEATIANCPGTKMVLTGYSQGAAVIDTTTDQLPPEAADHVAAVAVFGNPSSKLASKMAGGPLAAISPLYRSKTIDLCFPDDPVCSEGQNWDAHHQYVDSGMTTQAAMFVADKL
jgi:cutinase